MSALPCKYLPMYPQEREKLSINTLFEKVLVLDFKPTLRALTFLQFKIERKPFECSFCIRVFLCVFKCHPDGICLQTYLLQYINPGKRKEILRSFLSFHLRSRT